MSRLSRAWNSLHARLLVGAALWITAALALSDIAISALFRQHVTGQFLHELIDHRSELEGLTHVSPSGQVQLIRPVSDPRFETPGSGFYWQITGPQGPLAKSPSMADDSFQIPSNPPPPDPHPAHLRLAPQEVLVAERQVQADGRTLRFTVGADAEQLELVLGQFTRLLRTSLILLALGLMAAAGAQVLFGLRPMRRLRGKLAEVRAGRAQRLGDDFPTEVRPLVSDLNAMIDANHEMVRRARAQAGNLAHALKGPLAILTDEAERLRAAGRDEAAEVVRQQCATMSRQIDYQLARARAAAARADPGARTSVSQTAGDILSAMARLYGDRSLVFENELPPDLEAASDPQDLQEIVGNLLDNACKWAAGRVRIGGVALPGEPGRIRILVEDDGPGIAPEALKSVFAVGARLDEQKPGSGLGLAIVKDLVELYGGEVSLGRSALGGLAASIELPRGLGHIRNS